MKKALALTLVIIMLITVAACGGVSPEETTEATTEKTAATTTTINTEILFTNEPLEIPSEKIVPETGKYTLSSDYISKINRYISTDKSKVISGGALAYLDCKDLFGTESKSGETSGYCYCIFDEETMSLKPICSDEDCSHDGDNCFARNLAVPSSVNYCTVVSDRIVKSEFNSETLYFTYSDLDGNVLQTVEYELSNLLLPSGASAKKYAVSPVSTCRYENKVFFDVLNYTNQDFLDYEINDIVSEDPYYHWIVCLDLMSGAVYPVGGFEVPNPNMPYARFLECTEDKISCVYESNFYVTDINTGVTEVINSVNIIDRLVLENKLTLGSTPEAMLPLEGVIVSKYIISNSTTIIKYFDTNTMEEITPSETELIELNNPTGLNSEFRYNGKLYCMLKNRNGRDYRLVGSDGEISGTTEITKNREGKDGKYTLHNCFETEKGFVYYLIKRGATDVITKNENGVEVNYFLPLEMVYISKADIIDGGEVTPWYFNPETGLFEQ